jgi:selenocysteine lyase/cysteine desulfurase
VNPINFFSNKHFTNKLNNQNMKSPSGENKQIKSNLNIEKSTPAFSEIGQSMFRALETYANVHRSSGHFAMATTALFEKARQIVLDYAGLDNKKYAVIFCNSRQCRAITNTFKLADYKIITSQEVGLKLGVTALIVRKSQLKELKPVEPGGGTTRLYDSDWVMWAKAPERFESGTPAIINIIAFAKALLLKRSNVNPDFHLQTEKDENVNTLLYDETWQAVKGKDLLKKVCETRIGRHTKVPTLNGRQEFIHLDSSASAPTFEAVLETFTKTLQCSNEVQSEIVKEVENICLQTVGAGKDDYEVLLTGNATEAINLAAQNLTQKPAADVEPVILSSIIEHSSNDLPWRQVPGHLMIRLKTGKEGFLDLNEMEDLLKDYNQHRLYGKKRIVIIAISGASNVTGACNDLSKIGKLAHQYGAQFLVDAAQLIAHRKIDMKASHIDYLAFSGHKVYAPFGAGALIVRKGLLQFSDQTINEIKSSSGENAAGIAAMGKALLLVQGVGFGLIQSLESQHTAKLLNELEKIPRISMYGATPYNVALFENRIGVVAFDIKNKMAGKIAGKLAIRRGIGVRYGCLCAHLYIKYLMNFTPFLEKFQRTILQLIPSLELQGLIRASFGIHTSDEDIEALAAELKNIDSKLDKQSINKKESKRKMDEFIEARMRLVYGNF